MYKASKSFLAHLGNTFSFLLHLEDFLDQGWRNCAHVQFHLQRVLPQNLFKLVLQFVNNVGWNNGKLGFQELLQVLINFRSEFPF